MVDSHVLDALREALRHEGEVRLVTQGKKPEGKGLFPKRAKPYAQAIEACLNEEKPLLKAIREERKGKVVAQFVAITPQGVETLIEHTPLEEYERLVKEATAARQGELIEKCVLAAQKRFSEMEIERNRLAEAQQMATGVLLGLVTERVEQLEREKVQREQRLVEAAAMQKRLRNMLDTVGSGGEQRVEQLEREKEQRERQRRELRSEQEFDFQRDIAENLVYAWRDAGNPETQQALERTLLNAGVERIGQVGQRTEFDGRAHHTEDDLFPGDPAEIVKPGWRLVNQGGTSLIAKARVKKAN